MRIPFSKYEGDRNDFILVDSRTNNFRPDRQMIARLCDRHFGIGADGLIILALDNDANYSMRYYNADGSEGEMCGNGARCFALFAEHQGICTHGKIKFWSRDGMHMARIKKTYKGQGEVVLDMIDVGQIVCGKDWWFLNTGVPHYVEFVTDLSEVDVVRCGARICHDIVRFPQGTNVNFVRIVGPGELRMRTYERGVENETLACGTGATAAAIVANFAYQPNVEEFRVMMQGGELRVTFVHQLRQYYTDIRLSGPARYVYEGTFDTDNL